MTNKELFLISLILLAFPQLAFCTHYLDYFVYFEDQYLQGSSVCTNIVFGPDDEFLIPCKFNDLFGTIDLDVYTKILERLREGKPELYKGTVLLTKYSEEENWETLHVKTDVKSQAEFNTIMNEIVCSFSDYGENKYTIFSFTNPQLQKEYGGKAFSRKDISVLVFYLTDKIEEKPELFFPEEPQIEQPVETLLIEVPQKEEKLESEKAIKFTLRQAIWIQSIATTVLVIVTIFYVTFTYRMLYIQHRAYLKPTGFSIDDGNLKIKIWNFGPGLATNVEVKTVVLKKQEIAETATKKPLYFNTMDFPIAKGPFEVEKQTEALYSFDGLILFTYPFFISWRTITGGRQETVWRIFVEDNKIVPQNIFSKLKFKSWWIFMNLQSPYHNRIRKWWYFRKEKK